MAVRIYRICKMTGRYCDELVAEALFYKGIFSRHGIAVLDPVLIEGVPNEHRQLEALPDEVLSRLWARDKWCLREAHVAVNCNAALKSVGGEHEQGLMRYGYWKPLVLVYPINSSLPFIARHEDDLVMWDFVTTCKEIQRRWGSWFTKRLPWRLKMLAKSLPKLLFRQVRFLFQ